MRVLSRFAPLLGGLMVLGAASAASADTVFSNFNPGDSFTSGYILQGESVGSIGNVDQAVSFTVGPNSYYLTSVSLGIFVDTPPNTGTGPLDILIAETMGGAPGAILGTASLDVNTTGEQVLTTSFGGPLLTLNANTTYWVIADAKGSFDGGWLGSPAVDAGTTAGRSDNGSWNVRPNDDRMMALRVEGRAVPGAAIPEPGTFALVGAAVLPLAGGVVRRRGRRSA